MSTGRHTKLVGQAGEYLVAGELARRGYIATTFAGNVPDFDIVASNESGLHVSVQVKTISGSNWQFTIKRFCDISFEGTKQIIGDAKPCPIEQLVCVMVILRDEGDTFFVLPWTRLRDIVIEDYREYLTRLGGTRPRKPRSLHCALSPERLERYKDNWDLVKESLH